MNETTKRLFGYLRVTLASPVGIAIRAYQVHGLGGYSVYEAWEIVCIGQLYLAALREIDETGRP